MAAGSCNRAQPRTLMRPTRRRASSVSVKATAGAANDDGAGPSGPLPSATPPGGPAAVPAPIAAAGTAAGGADDVEDGMGAAGNGGSCGGAAAAAVALETVATLTTVWPDDGWSASLGRRRPSSAAAGAAGAPGSGTWTETAVAPSPPARTAGGAPLGGGSGAPAAVLTTGAGVARRTKSRSSRCRMMLCSAVTRSRCSELSSALEMDTVTTAVLCAAAEAGSRKRIRTSSVGSALTRGQSTATASSPLRGTTSSDLFPAHAYA